jgi:hypothetical protein
MTTPPRLRFLKSVRNTLFNWSRRQQDDGIKLRGPRPAVVDVPLGQGRPVSPPVFPSRSFHFTCVIQRYYTANELRIKKEKEKEEAKNAKNAKNASASGSRPPQSHVTPQSAEVAQGQPSSEMHAAAVFTSSTAPAVSVASAVTTLATSLPDAMMPRAGCWRLYLLHVCSTYKWLIQRFRQFAPAFPWIRATC